VATQPYLTWEQYQALPPEKRSRPLTPAEYAAAMQRSEGGAPADFNGPVFPNPDHIVISDDTDSGIPDLRLPNGVKATTGAYNGTPKLDTSNPASAQVLPATMQTVGANYGADLDVLRKQDADATVPMIDPEGKLRDIPASQIIAARNAGAKMTVRVKAPDGKIRLVPSDQASAAAQAGGQILPIEEQAVQHEGFWKSLGGDLGDMVTGAITSAPKMTLKAMGVSDPREDAAHIMEQVEHYKEQKKAGYGLGYRVVSPLAENLGVNVRGSEKAAGEGDTAGVAGHAAAPVVALVATEGLTKGTNAIASRMAGTGEAASAATKAGREAAVAGTKAAIKKLPRSMIKRIPYVGQVAADVAEAAKNAYTESKNAAAARVAPETAVVEDLEGVTSPQTESAGETPIEQVPEETQNAAASRAKVNTSPKAVKQQLEKSLGATPEQKTVVPGVKIKNQPIAQATKLPEGFTPTPDSSHLRGYKYDPATQEFDAITQTGARYRHGNVSPEQFAKFEAAKSKGSAWNSEIKNGPGVTPLGKPNAEGVITNPRTKPQFMRSVEVDPETGQPEFSDVLEQKRKNLQDFITPEKPAAAETKPAAKTTKAKAKASAPAEDDLLSKLQQSVEQAKAGKGGVMASADPAELAKRWGVDEESLKAGREQTRGWRPMETEAELKKLEARYRKGQPVEPVMETRDANNNLIDVDGRGRAIAAKRAGVKRIPVIVRRIGVQ